MKMENNQKNQLNIEISDEVAEGKYSNLAIITHSPNEFIVDFAQMMPGTPKAKVRTRVIMNPVNAKRLYKALADNGIEIPFPQRDVHIIQASETTDKQ